MADKASRASLDIDPHMHSNGAASDAKQRKNTLDESMRKTAGPEAVAFYARQNPAINTAMTHRNIDCVNDGEGGFRPAESIDEVMEYGTERRNRLSKEIKGPREDKNGKHYDGERHAVTVVGQLPWSLCEPDGTFYHPLDEHGEPKDGLDGRPLVSLPRYRAIDEAEMQRYFDEYLDFLSDNVLPGGQASIHGFSINLDETRPHIQVLADPFMPDARGKEPDALKSGFSRAFGSHRSDRRVVQTDKKHGNPVLKDGKPKMVGEGASRKYERYHRELKAHMLEAGFDIEAERDEVRHGRRVDLDDYKQIEDQRQHVAATASEVEEHQAAAIDVLVDAHEMAAEAERDASELDDKAAQIDSAAVARTAALDQREAALDELAAEIPRLRAAAVDEGRAEGREAGRAEVATELAAATAAKDLAEQARAAAAEHERRQREAADEAEADRAAAADDRRAAAAERQAIGETLDRVDDLASRAEKWADYDHGAATEAIPDPHMRTALAIIPAFEQTPSGYALGPDGKPVKSTALEVAGMLAPALAERDRQAAARVRESERDVRTQLERRTNGGSTADAIARIEEGERTMAQQDRARELDPPDQSQGQDW